MATKFSPPSAVLVAHSFITFQLNSASSSPGLDLPHPVGSSAEFCIPKNLKAMVTGWSEPLVCVMMYVVKKANMV